MLRLSVIATLALAACGGSKQSAMAPAPEATQATGGGAEQIMPASPHDQIQKLDDEITASVGQPQLKLEEPVPGQIEQASTQPMGKITAEDDPKCKPAKNDTCKTSCTLSNSVCSNADKICTLAKSMAGDNWALNKCARANLMCEASHKKCCGCQ